VQIDDVIAQLKSMKNSANVEGMARFGINPENTLGLTIPVLRAMKKAIGKNHDLALQLWDSGIHEARILASMVDDPKQVDEAQMERWVSDFDSWDVCDQVCSNLFQKTAYSNKKAVEWSGRDEAFVKRAGCVLMARIAVADKKAADETFIALLPIIQREADDERNYVKKAVNWALRQIGKRNLNLNAAAIQTARDIQQSDSRAAGWVAFDALRELQSDAVQERLRQKAKS
jgi:3-methyladenine DNA glycosylase AlkD